jgi:hypothetical protein
MAGKSQIWRLFALQEIMTGARRGALRSKTKQLRPLAPQFPILHLRSRAESSSGASLLDNLVDLPGAKLVRAFRLGFLADCLQNLGLRCGQPDVIAEAEQHGPRRSPLFDHQRAALFFHATQKIAKVRARVQRGNAMPSFLFVFAIRQTLQFIVPTKQLRSSRFNPRLKRGTDNPVCANHVCGMLRTRRILNPGPAFFCAL